MSNGMSNIRSRVYTIAEAAAILRVSPATAYAAAARGELPVMRIGKSLRVPGPALDKLLGATPEGRPLRRRARPSRWAKSPVELIEEGAAA